MTALTLHIGTHKTGSTAIQRSLERSTGLAEGILFPKSGRMPGGGHLNLAWETAGDSRFRAERGGTADLIAEIRTARPTHVLLSAETWTTRPGEHLHAEWASKLAQQIGAHSVHIVAYVRPQWQYLESVYTQQIKMGFISDSFRDFLDRYVAHPRFEYELVFQPWFDRFDVQIEPYGSEVVAHFWALAGLGSPPQTERANERPGAKELEMIRCFSRQIPRDQRQPKLRAVRRWLRPRIESDTPYSGLTMELVHIIHERFCVGNRAFAEAVWGDSDPPVFQPPEQVHTNTWTLSAASPEERQLFEELIRRFT